MSASSYKHLPLDGIDTLTNLSIEEAISDSIEPDTVMFMLYTNMSSVVIGKNQNPLLETNPIWLERHHIPLFRRISGGGTVWHDEGNLCYSFIYKQGSREPEENHGFLIDAFLQMGISLSRNDRGDLLLDGKKCSGNALSHRRGITIHHGTLLIKSNLELLSKALRPLDPWPYTIQKQGIQSQRVEVTQISTKHPTVTKEDIESRLIKGWLEKNKSELFNLGEFVYEKSPEIEKISQRHRSWDWVFGRSPDFILYSDEENLTVSGGFVEKSIEIDQWIRLQKLQKLWNND